MKISVLTFIISSFFISCKKYPENEHISLRTPERRLYGTWEIADYTVDGIDSTEYFLQVYNYKFLRFKKPEGRSDRHVFIKSCVECQEQFKSSWYLQNKKSDIWIEAIGSGNKNTRKPSGSQENYLWNIKILYKGKLKLTSTYFGKNYIVTLIKV